MSSKDLSNRIPETAPAETYHSLQRRDWELWSIALLLMTVFAAGILLYFYAETSEERILSATAARFIWLAVLGLIALVVLLNIYLIGRKRALGDLWRRYLLQLQELERERELGMLDPLTEVCNRRYFDEVIPREIRRSKRTNCPLSFLLLDVDDFKKINQEQGHFVADQVLRDVAAIVRSSLRASDYAFRFGGDEFLVALPDTPSEGASVVSRRLTERLAMRTDLSQRLRQRVTISVGAATYQRGQDLNAVIDQVEGSLDRAKALRSADGAAAADLR